MSRPRKKPYTTRGIRRVPCARCGEPSVYQWQICSDGNQYRGFCAACDVALNRLVLQFVGLPNWEAMHDAYRAKVEAEA